MNCFTTLLKVLKHYKKNNGPLSQNRIDKLSMLCAITVFLYGMKDEMKYLNLDSPIGDLMNFLANQNLKNAEEVYNLLLNEYNSTLDFIARRFTSLVPQSDKVLISMVIGLLHYRKNGQGKLSNALSNKVENPFIWTVVKIITTPGTITTEQQFNNLMLDMEDITKIALVDQELTRSDIETLNQIFTTYESWIIQQDIFLKIRQEDYETLKVLTDVDESDVLMDA